MQDHDLGSYHYTMVMVHETNPHNGTVDDKFLVAGRSYMEYSEDFGLIEKSKKITCR